MSTTTWKIDAAHSGVQFTVRHMVVAKVRGSFRRWSAQLLIDAAEVTRSSMEISIEAGSVDTGQAPRDEHLRSPDFLDTASAAHSAELRTARRSARRLRALLVATAVLLVVAIAAGSVSLVQRGEARDRARAAELTALRLLE